MKKKLAILAGVLAAPIAASAQAVDMSAIGTGALAQLNDTVPDILPVVGAVVAIALGIKLFKKFVS
jgi:hypothetical protein